ncbi:uncharacterized protein LOC143922899 [Arctopsyche grandis]|uniref:uncharacterized protein LOC143921463 n=1 Tax=Arctopsyche grandis TaxID=121162 RepID=UPI00406D9997
MSGASASASASASAFASASASASRNSYTSILRLKCEKLKYEIENIKIQRQVLSMSRKNILLHIENLNMKFVRLNYDICELKNQMIVKCDNEIKPVNEDDAVPITPKEEVFVLDNQTNAENRVPYILLLKSKNKCASRKRVYIEKIFDTEIKECFEIISVDPFEISPVNNDITLKEEHYEAMKPCVIRGLSSCKNLIPCITVQESKNSKQRASSKNGMNESTTNSDKNNESPKVVEERKGKNVIDLTDSEESFANCVQNTDVSAKRKNETESSSSMKVLKKCVTVQDSSVETTTEITKTTTTTKVLNLPNIKIDLDDGVIEIN